MTIIPPGYADCSIELRNAALSRSAFITFGVRIDGGIAVDTVAQKVMDSIVLDPAPNLLSLIDSDVTVLSSTARVGQDGGLPLVFTAFGITTGVASGGGMPANCALLLKKRTARGGRRGRGRIFLPWGQVETKVDEAGKITNADVTAAQLGVTSWFNQLATNNVPMVVLHSESSPDNKHGPTAPGAPDLVTGLVVDAVIATQRRRMPRR